jgi:tripartite-type tricarboxylate transporter receptor subunit TctC
MRLVKLAVSAVALLAGFMSAALAQEKFPVRPVELVVPWGPGGGADQLGRKAGQLMEETLKVSIPVVNAPGATGNSGMAKMLAGNSDGYSMAILIGDTLATLATGSAKWKLSDVNPLGVMVRQPSGLFVKQGSRFKTWNDVVAAARSKPGSIKVAILGFGSVDDMTVSYLASKGIKLLPVPYANPGERYTAVLGDHTDLLYEQAGDIRSYIDNKQIRPILFFSRERIFDGFADIPCSKEVGLEVYLPQFRSIVVKAGVDPLRAKLLADALAKAANDPEYVAFLKQSLARRDSFIPAKDAAKFIEGELDAMKQFVSVMAKK